MYHSTLGSRVIKTKRSWGDASDDQHSRQRAERGPDQPCTCHARPHTCHTPPRTPLHRPCVQPCDRPYVDWVDSYSSNRGVRWGWEMPPTISTPASEPSVAPTITPALTPSCGTRREGERGREIEREGERERGRDGENDISADVDSCLQDKLRRFDLDKNS